MLGWKKSLERGGTMLSYKLFIEDLFIRNVNAFFNKIYNEQTLKNEMKIVPMLFYYY